MRLVCPNICVYIVSPNTPHVRVSILIGSQFSNVLYYTMTGAKYKGLDKPDAGWMNLYRRGGNEPESG